MRDQQPVPQIFWQVGASAQALLSSLPPVQMHLLPLQL
jgi:hypothetical protein